MGVPFVIEVVDGAGAPAACVLLRTVDQQELVTDAAGLVAFDEPGLMDDLVWFFVESPSVGVDPDFFGYEGRALRTTPGTTGRIVVERRRADPACAVAPAAVDGYIDPPFDLHVVDSVTGRGVPMVRVDGAGRTWWTDSAGHVAIRETDVVGTPLTLTPASLHGYHPVVPTLDVVPEAGGSATVSVQRELPAERWYRSTGRGIYRDSLLLGLPAPMAEPVISGRVMGQDTIMVVPRTSGDLWLWGDTLKPDYPLGNFDMAGAIAAPLPASVGVDLDYYVDAAGFARAMAPIPGSGPTWLAGPWLLDDGGVPVVAAVYGNFDQDLTANERGVAVWDEATATFVKDTAWPDPELNVTINAPLVRDGRMVAKEGYRFAATLDAARDPSSWEVRSSAGASWPDGEPDIRWRPFGEAAPEPADTLVDHVTGAPVVAHGDSIAFSAWRRRWHRVFTQNGGTSWLGEMWYAEADSPFGPWEVATKIATHSDYTSYNPLLHEELAGDGRVVPWQATYTAWLATDDPTPRYDYNQVMYGLDLEDPRVNLPTPVYRLDDGALATLRDLRAAHGSPPVAFLAPDRIFDGAIAVGPDGPACDGGTWVAGDPLETVFFASPTAAPGGVALHRATWGAEEGLFAPVPAGWTADADPVGYVWPARRTRSDVGDWLPDERVDAGPDACLEPGGSWTFDPAASTVAGGSWALTVDGVDVAIDAVVDTPGRHVATATWTSPAGSPVRDTVVFAIPEGDDPPTGHTGEPPADHTGTVDTDEPPDAPTDGGCGCDQRGGVVWPVAAALVLLRRRRA